MKFSMVSARVMLVVDIYFFGQRLLVYEAGY